MFAKGVMEKTPSKPSFNDGSQSVKILKNQTVQVETQDVDN